MSLSWYSPELNIKAALQEGSFEVVSNYVDQNSDHLMALWNANDKETLKKSVSFGYGAFHRITRWLKGQSTNMQSVFSLGMLWGTIKSFNHILFCDSEKDAVASPRFQELRYVSHLNEILSVLLAEGSISHTDLSAQLKLRTSTLTEAMKRILPYGLIHVSSAGKFKLYSLTDLGRRYIRQIKDYPSLPAITGTLNIVPPDNSSDTSYASFRNPYKGSRGIQPGDVINLSWAENGIIHQDNFTICGIDIPSENSLVPKEVLARKENTGNYSNLSSITAYA